MSFIIMMHRLVDYYLFLFMFGYAQGYPFSKPYHNCPQYVLEGDHLSCTCFVNDLGTPPGVLQWNTTGSPNLRLLDVKAQDYGTQTCMLLWNNTVVQSVDYVLNIAFPPSVPEIFPLSSTAGRHTYPFMAGTSGTLGCLSNQTGHPEAAYTWPVATTGHASGSNLTFYNLSSEDNGRRVKCRVSNFYTEYKQPVDDATFVLQVYYEPVIQFLPLSDVTDCSRTSGQSLCVVPEGQKLRIDCIADSNPEPSSLQWIDREKNVIFNSSELMISSANDSLHNGDYYCTVITKHDGDSRLPLTSSAKLTVIVSSPRDRRDAVLLEKTDEKTVTIVVLAVVLAAVVVLILASVICVWQRGWTLPCVSTVPDFTSQRHIQKNEAMNEGSDDYLHPVSPDIFNTREVSAFTSQRNTQGNEAMNEGSDDYLHPVSPDTFATTEAWRSQRSTQEIEAMNEGLGFYLHAVSRGSFETSEGPSTHYDTLQVEEIGLRSDYQKLQRERISSVERNPVS